MVTGLEAVWGFRAIGELFKLAKEAKDLTDSTAVQAKLASIYPLVLQAQVEAIEANKAHAADVERISDLEKEVARLKTWDGEKENYELKAVDTGALAYMLKPEHRGTEPAHWLCANCYQDGKKGILQAQGSKSGVGPTKDFRCPSCKTGFATHWGEHPRWL